MVLGDTLVASKNESLDISALLKIIFKTNWDEDFLYNSLDGGVFTYKSFFQAVLTIRTALNSLGLRANDVVCLLMPNSVELVILYFACLVSKLRVVPIDPKKGKDEIKEILSYTNYKKVVTREDFEFLNDTVRMDELHEQFHNPENVDIDMLNVFDDINYKNVFLITFTSGSTGVPKGVMHSFNNLVLSAIAFRDRYSFSKEHIFYHNLPMTYMAGILNLIILPFISGSKIVIGERFGISDIKNFWRAPIRYSVNTFWFIPTMISLLLKLDRGTKGIEYAKRNKIIGCVGTAALSAKARRSFEERYNIPLYESYGLSETLFVTTNSPNNCKADDSTGTPLKGVHLSFDIDDEILIEVPWMFLGYSNFDSNSCFKGGRFRSGDFGEIDSDNYLTITGRKKNLIMKGGISISPKKIEDFVSAYNYFEESVIIGGEDENLGEKTVCFCVSSNMLDIKEVKKTLNRSISEKLGVDYRIDEFVQCDSIPKNINGKIDRQRIKMQYINQNQ